VAPEGAVLEQAPAFRAVAGGPSDVVDNPERGAGNDAGVSQVVLSALDPAPTPPLSVPPIRIAPVPGAHVEGHEAQGVDLDGQRLASRSWSGAWPAPGDGCRTGT